MTKIAAIQMASGTNVSANLIEVSRQILSATQAGAKLIVLPENFAFMGMKNKDQLAICEQDGVGPIQEFLSEQAKKNKVWLVAGTFPLCVNNKEKVYATCLVIDDQGQRISRYDKIHLFDVHLSSSSETYHESETIDAGNQVVTVDTPFGKIGLAICYDLRFPELFRKLVMQGTQIIIVPSAFTAVTGQAHWEVLLRARAIENLSYVVASGQGGFHVNGRETYGDSMIVDPWGVILDRLPHGSGYVIADVDVKNVENIRQSFPALQHRKISCALPTE